MMRHASCDRNRRNTQSEDTKRHPDPGRRLTGVHSAVGAATGRPLMTAIVVAAISCTASGIVEPLAASAQVVGDRIRVTLSSGEVVGVLTETRSAELVLERWGGDLAAAQRVDPAALLRIRRAEIQQLELHSGTRNYKWWGLAGGYLLGVVFVEATKEDVNSNCWLWCGWTLAGFVVGHVAPLAGFIVGSRVRGDKWESIPHASAVGPTLSPAIGVQTRGHGGSSVYMGIRVRQRDE